MLRSLIPQQASNKSSIEIGILSGSGQGNVMDAFLTHACDVITQMTKDLVQLAINFRSVDKKQKSSYTVNFISELSKFPPKNASFSMLKQTFSNLASNSIFNVVKTLDTFFPSILSNNVEVDQTSKSLLYFFPSYQTQGEEMLNIVGFLSEATYAAFLQSFLENVTDIKDTDATNILERLFNLTNQTAQLTTLQMDVLKLSISRYSGVLKRITQHRLSDFAILFKNTFPTKKSTPQHINLYMSAIQGLSFGEHNYSKIEESIKLIPKILKMMKSNSDVVNAICLCLCNIVPQLTNLHQEDFLKTLEHRATKSLKDHVAWASALKLIGCIHYVAPPQMTTKYTKFLEAFVFKRFKKPHKINAALDYVIAALRPNDECSYRWSPQTGELIRLVFDHLFSVPLAGLEVKAALVLEHIAALDLPTFKNELLPKLLQKDSKYAAVALITVQKILNPMSRFQELAKAVPTNAATGIHKQVQTIILFVKEYVIQRFRQYGYVSSNFLMTIRSISDILLELDVPQDLAQLNLMNFPSTNLLYLLKWREFSPITSLKPENKSAIENANKVCEHLIQQWMTTFDTPHNSFGVLLEMDNTALLEEVKFTDSIDVNILPIIPILLCYSNDYNELLHPLFCLMLSNDPYICAQANIIYQLIFLSFPSSGAYFLEMLNAYIQQVMNYSVYQIHQFVQTYYYCLLSSKGQYGTLSEKILDQIDFVAFTCFCSPFPETHIIGLQIIDLSKLVKHLVPNSMNNKSILDVLEENSTIIEQKIIMTVISEFSTWSESSSPYHRMPTISFRNAALSKYHLLWRFALDQLTDAMVKYPLTHMILKLRKIYLKYSESILKSDFFPVFDKYNISLTTNIFIFVFSSSTTAPTQSTKEEKKKWAKQLQKIDNLISLATTQILILQRENLVIFSFIFTALNIVALAKAISSFLKTLTSQDIKLFQKENSLSVFATMLRHVAMQTSFDDYAAKMFHSGQIKEILSIFDTSLQIFIKVKGEDHYIQLFHHLEQFSHFLVFRGQYFRFLHQSRIEAPHCPIPRCALTTKVDDQDISPICTAQELFYLLFDWSLIGLEGAKNPEYDAALANEPNPPDKQQLIGLGHAARVALSYLVPLQTIFADAKDFTPEFMNKVSIIAKARPSFLKHLLTKHLPFLLSIFCEKALSAELEIGTIFLNSITAQFIPPTVKDSMIYSHNTFLKNMSTTSPMKISEYDKNFTQLIYSQTGTLLLVDLFYLLHNDINIRQNALRMICQVFPILCLMHNNGDTESTKLFMNVASRLVNSISTQNITLRIENAFELSYACSKAFNYCSEQFIYYAFQALPSSFLNRRVCSREHLLKIITPWMTEATFDINSKTLFQNPSKFFCYFSPYSFVNQFTTCMLHANPYTLLLPLWQTLIQESIDPDRTCKYVTIALLDIAMSNSPMNQEVNRNIRYVLTYIYRMQPQIIRIITNLLHYSSWYYYHVQLGKYEEINDMSEFLEQFHKTKDNISMDLRTMKRIHSGKKNDNYAESINFAMEVLKDFAQEDILPVANTFNVIVSFCLTHIHMKNAFDLLYTIAENLNHSFNSGSPECLWNACEILSRISSVQFDVIRFVPEDPETPLRALQKRVVSISSLLQLFNKIYSIIPTDSEDDISLYLLMWGLSCGDLQTAATALNLYASSYETTNKNVINHIIESCCLVARCIVEAPIEQRSLEHSAEYICAIFRTIRVIVTQLAKAQQLDQYPQLLFLPIAFLGLNGPLLKHIIDDCLQLITTIINHGVFDEKSKNAFNLDSLKTYIKNYNENFTDMRPLLKIALLNCTNTLVIIQFLMQITKLPTFLLSNDNDYTNYASAFAPFVCCSIEDPQLFSKICRLSNFTEALKRLSNLFPDSKLSQLINDAYKGKFTDAESYAIEYMKALAVLAKPELFIDSADIYTAMLSYTPQIALNCVFDLCSGIMSIFPTPETLSALIPLTKTATVTQNIGDFSRKVKYLQTITSFTETMSIKAEAKETQLVPSFEKEWINSIIFIQAQTVPYLHTEFRNQSKVVRIRIDEIEYFPPLYPFEQNFTECNCIEAVSDVCRQIQVNPQSNWADSLYFSQDITDLKAAPTEKPNLDYTIDYDSILEDIVEVFRKEEEDEEEDNYGNNQRQQTVQSAKPVKAYSEDPIDISNDDTSQELFMLKEGSFLPPDNQCDQIVSSILQKYHI